MTTEKIRVSASSVISSVPETSATPARWRGDSDVSVVMGGQCSIRNCVHLRRAFVAGAVLWAVLLPAAAFAASRPEPAQAWYALAFVIYAAGSVLCHQLPARSFHLWATQ